MQEILKFHWLSVTSNHSLRKLRFMYVRIYESILYISVYLSIYDVYLDVSYFLQSPQRNLT